MKENRIFSQRYAIVTTNFFHLKWLVAKFQNFRISFQVVSDGHPCHLMIQKGFEGQPFELQTIFQLQKTLKFLPLK